ncbi:hypothetical protein ABIB57_000639 [Devosia sp. UYZn731]|uniref:hypothetical protein n=1 Tax=Devosia sp. UYZn731 TaxID=3156345 RepID=UPI003397B2F7
MSEAPADFAVVGSTPLARLVAGLLASVHGKRVIWIGDSHAAFRLPRGIDLSFGPMTRPESWALLSQTVPETVKLLAKAGGKASMMRLDPIFFADTPIGQQAMAFVCSSAAGFGAAIEPLPSGHLGKGRKGIVLRDALYLQRDRLEPVLDRWLEGLGVTRVPPAQVHLHIAPNGSASMELDGTVTAATRAVLADDEAILAHLPTETIARLFERRPMTTILTEPTFQLSARVMLQIDADLSFMQGSHGGVVAIGAGGHDACVSHIGVLLGANRQLRQAGGNSHESLRSHDGAPVVGSIDGTGPELLAGLGATGAFLAPALARWFVGAATQDELSYFAARIPGRATAPSIVADYAPHAALAAA